MSLPYSATLTPGKALTIDVRSRRSERRIAVLALGGVVLTAMLLALPLLLAVTAAVVVMLGFRWQGWLGGADRLTAVSWLSDGRWILTGADRKNIPATLSAETRIGHGWLWLRWHTGCEVAGAGRSRRSMLLLRGDVLPAELRRLNARLRLESGAWR